MIMTLGLGVSAKGIQRLSKMQGNQRLRDIASSSTIDLPSVCSSVSLSNNVRAFNDEDDQITEQSNYLDDYVEMIVKDIARRLEAD
jgi:hypothetical protein